MLSTFIVVCPHCGCSVEIVEVNCAIFRHAVYKDTGAQVDPHAPKELCDALAAAGRIHGCGQPFRVIQGTGGWAAVECDYL
jgi:hypothetical protein